MKHFNLAFFLATVKGGDQDRGKERGEVLMWALGNDKSGINKRGMQIKISRNSKGDVTFMSNLESLQRGGGIETSHGRMSGILICIVGRAFHGEKISLSKGVRAKNTILFQEWHVTQCS